MPTGVPTLRANLADYSVTKAIKDGRVKSDIARELYRMVVESRGLTEGGAPAIFPPIGLEANRKGLQLAIDWALDQKIISRRLSVDELFDDVTGSLG